VVELVNFELDGLPLSTEEEAVPTPVTDMTLCSDEFDIFCEEIDCASVERLWSGPLGWFFLAGSFSAFLWFFVKACRSAFSLCFLSLREVLGF